MRSQGNDGDPRPHQDARARIFGRRKYLAAAGGVAFLAGCLGDDGDGGGDDQEPPDDDGPAGFDPADLPDDIRVMARLGESELPGDMNFNPYSQTPPGTHTMDLCHDLLACNPYQGEIVLRGLDDWSWDPDSAVLTKTLRDDLVFWNGDQLTAEDVHAYDELNRVSAGSPYTEINVVDDLTIEYTIESPPNENLVRNQFLPGRTRWQNANLWTEWLERFEDASSDEEIDEVTQNLAEHSRGIDEWLDGRGGTGVFEIVDYSETEIHYEPVNHGDHRYSDDLNIQGFKMIVTEYGSSRADEFFADGQIDTHTSALDPQYVGVVPDYIENVALWELMFAYQIIINERNHDALRDYNFRRAMASVINTANVSTNFGDTRSNPIETHSGLDPSSNEQYWGDDLGQLLDYSAQDSDHDRADYWLEQSGYSRDGGTIVDDAGDEVDDIRFFNGGDFLFQIPGETAAQQMQEYGFPIDYNEVPRSQKTTTVDEKMGEWDLSMTSHYAAGDNHASSFFHPVSRFGNRMVGAQGGEEQLRQWYDEGKERSPYNGKPLKLEIPTQLGQEDLSGDTKEIHRLDWYKRARSSNDQDEVNQLIRDLSHMHNFHLSSIDVLYLISGYVGNTRDYDWPSEDVLLQHQPNGPYRVVHDGTVDYSNQVKNEYTE